MVIEFFPRPYNNWTTTVCLTRACILALEGLRDKGNNGIAVKVGMLNVIEFVTGISIL